MLVQAYFRKSVAATALAVTVLSGFTALPSETIKSPGIDECGLILECRTMYTSDIDPANLSSEIGAYASGDYHRIYYGLIQRTVADEDFAERLRA